MKKSCFLGMLILVSGICFGQKSAKEVGRRFFQEVTTENGITTVTSYRQKDKLKIKMTQYSDYEKGIRNGVEIRWWENGMQKLSASYKNNRLDGPLVTNYQNGAVRRMEFYEGGLLKDGKCFSENGKKIAYFPFEQRPVFGKGDKDVEKYLAKNLRYPENITQKPEMLKVTVFFLVTKSGKVKVLNATTVEDKKDYEPFIKEAKRVVEEMPNWQVGLRDGEPTVMRMTIPILFANPDLKLK